MICKMGGILKQFSDNGNDLFHGFEKVGEEMCLIKIVLNFYRE